jgi:hypothetical protein
VEQLTAAQVMTLRPAGAPPGQVVALAVHDLGLALAVVVLDDGSEVEGHELQFTPGLGWRIEPWPDRPDVAAAAGWDPARADGTVRVQVGGRRDSVPVTAWGYWAYITAIEPGTDRTVDVFPGP